MYKTLVPLLFASVAVYAADADPMADVCDRLIAALEQETEALASISQPADVPAAMEKLQASIAAQKALFSVDSKLLWQYIDNTAGVKQPIIDAMEKLALQFARVVAADFYGSAELRAVLGPQVLATEDTQKANHAKREKLREIDHDED